MAFNFGELKTGNPSLRRAFQGQIVDVNSNTMTVSGAINKSGILFLLLVAGAFVGWGLPETPYYAIGFFGSMIIGFILSLVISFNQRLAPTLAPIYALLEGVMLGAISSIYEAARPGLAFNAMCLTFAVLGLMLGLYHFRDIRFSEKLMSIIMLATGAIAITYLVDIIMGLFGHPMMMLHNSSPLSIGISLVIVGVAALNLIIDFEVITRGADSRAPKYMEWYGGFALLVTVVWLYLEILRLLLKLSSDRR